MFLSFEWKIAKKLKRKIATEYRWKNNNEKDLLWLFLYSTYGRKSIFISTSTIWLHDYHNIGARWRRMQQLQKKEKSKNGKLIQKLFASSIRKYVARKDRLVPNTVKRFKIHSLYLRWVKKVFF
jgi:hypothetical protein